MPLNKPWTRFNAADLRGLPPNLGVYELGDADGRVVHVGYAGGRSRFGLRGAIADHFGDAEPDPVIRERAVAYRFEVNQMYLTRWRELLMRRAVTDNRAPDGAESPRESRPGVG